MHIKKLFSEFEGVTSARWKEQITKDLKGIDLNQLVWKTHNGFDVRPFYTAEDLDGKKEPLFTGSEWDICEHIVVVDEKEANRKALKALEGGASGLVLHIHKKIDTAVLIKGISLEHIYSQFSISNDALHVLHDLKAHYAKINLHDGKIKCFVNIDPLSLLAFYGEWHDNEETDLSILKQLQHVPVNVSLYEEAGASTVNELAIGLAHANEYLNYLSEQNAVKEKKTLHLSFSVAPDFFTEIAKLRAARKLIALLQQQYAINLPVHFHAQTAWADKSRLDIYNNMLRTTTEAMSAVIGGANSLSVLPYNEGFEKPNDFASRIARNQQHILKDESYLNKVADIAAGSYYIESITDSIAEKAWEQFKVIESKGGFIACLKNNFIQDLITQGAESLKTEFKEGKLVLVGVNKYENKTEVVRSSEFVVQSKDTGTKTLVKPIKPIRIAEELEKQRSSTNSELPTSN
jgi:methylmalonyl-CoA mutase